MLEFRRLLSKNFLNLLVKQGVDMSNLFVSEHPLVKHKSTHLRSVETGHRSFRELAGEITALLAYEATKDLILVDKTVTTPMGQAEGKVVVETVGLAPVLRAGLGMEAGFMQLLPEVEVRHLGMYRDEETLTPVWYYEKLPDEPTVQICFVLDPMLATGGTAVAAVSLLKKWGVKRIKYIGLLGAPEGVEALSKAHPNVPIHLAELDSHLNDIGYIVPGLGDAGDRMYGT